MIFCGNGNNGGDGFAIARILYEKGFDIEVFINKENMKFSRDAEVNFKKIKANKRLSPILLVRSANELIIADGYHRLCCSYYLTEDLDVPCRLIYVE